MAKLSRLSLFCFMLLSICAILFTIGSGKGGFEAVSVSDRRITEILLENNAKEVENPTQSSSVFNSSLTMKLEETKEEVNCSNVDWTSNKDEDPNWFMCYTPYDPLACFHDPIHCKHHFHAITLSASEMHDAMPKYGEYNDLPIEKWVLVLQHGGVVFLYHPCSNKTVIQNLRFVADSCLHRYIIAPSYHLNTSHPVAMVTWGCFYKAKNVNQLAFQTWIKDKAIKGPASYIPVNGKYVEGLVRCSEIVSDILDTHLCPNDTYKPNKKKNELPKHDVAVKHLLNLIYDYHQPEINRTMKEHHHSEDAVYYEKEDISIKIQRTHRQGSLRSKFDKGNAAWALGSIVFLCVVLIIGYVFGKPQKATRNWTNTVYKNSNEESMFALLKSDVPHIRIENNSEKSSRTQGQYRSLLHPIPEDSDDDEGG